jgi:hypothetical protein
MDFPQSVLQPNINFLSSFPFQKKYIFSIKERACIWHALAM